MNILIVEDEDLAVKKIQKTLVSIQSSAVVAGVTDSIRSTVEWLQQNPAPDLILMDIELCDGQSFEIFKLVEVTSPVIFTTSYDEYALKAFKVNSIDYLLKPVQKDELQLALDKYHQMKLRYAAKEGPDGEARLDVLLRELRRQLEPKEYRKRFLVKQGQKLVSIDIGEIAYFFSDGRLNFFKTSDNRKFVVDYTMDELEEMIDPKLFFRISRAFYVSVACIDRIEEYFGNRLILTLRPALDKEALVSREKVADFKKWMGK
jgi:DNA-binding LytR/AlgR family response regulator